MIDYLLAFTDEAQAIKVASDMRIPDGSDWNRSFVIPDVRVFKQDADTKDEAGGFYMWVSTRERELFELDEFCLLASDRESGKIVHSRLSLDTLSVLRIEPIMAGTTYGWGEAKQIGRDLEAVAIKADARALTFAKAEAVPIVKGDLAEVVRA